MLDDKAVEDFDGLLAKEQVDFEASEFFGAFLPVGATELLQLFLAVVPLNDGDTVFVRQLLVLVNFLYEVVGNRLRLAEVVLVDRGRNYFPTDQCPTETRGIVPVERLLRIPGGVVEKLAVAEGIAEHLVDGLHGAGIVVLGPVHLKDQVLAKLACPFEFRFREGHGRDRPKLETEYSVDFLGTERVGSSGEKPFGKFQSGRSV